MRELTDRRPVAAGRTPLVRSSSERGIVLPLVAFGLVALLGLAALAIDMGNNLSEHRRLTTATDAAALAAAEVYAVGGDGCATTAADYLARNAEEATLISCTPTGDLVTGSFGWVVVEAELVVDQFVAPTIGFDTATVGSQSMAVFGAPDGCENFCSPIAPCIHTLMTIPDFLLWLLSGPDATSAKIRLDFTPDQLIGCGVAGWDMALIDFDGGVAYEEDLAAWIEFGYSDKVELGWHSAEPGRVNGTHHEQLRSLVEDGEPFWMPIIADVQENVPGATVYVVNFIAVRLTDFQVTGPPDDQYVEFIIDPSGISAGCCAVPPVFDPGSRETALFNIGPDGTPIGLNS